MRRILSKVTTGTSSTLYLQNDLPFVPTPGEPVYGTTNFFMVSPQYNEQSLEFYIQGENTNDTWVATGMQGNLGFTHNVGEPVMFSAELAGPTHTSGGLDALGIGTITTPVPAVFKAERGAEVRFYPSPTNATSPAAYSPIAAHTLALAPNIQWLDVPAQNGVEGVLRKYRDDQPPVCALTLTMYYEGAASDALWDARDQLTDYGIEIQHGPAAGNLSLISFPRCQIIEVQRVAAGALAGVQVQLACLLDETATSDSGLSGVMEEMMLSAFSIARG